MGDRNNPIKFGPEWLRNLPREQVASRTNNTSSPSTTRPTGSQRLGGSASSASSQAATGSVASSPPSRSTGSTQRPGATGSGSTSGASGGTSGASGGTSISASPSGMNTRNSNSHGSNTSRILLARLRYGREEMLALYDRNVEAPDDLKHFDSLYQPRGKPPAALNNYEDDTRDNGRGGPPMGASGGERFGHGRGGIARGFANEPRLVKTRSPFTRGSGNPRMPGYNGGEEEAANLRAWSTSNGASGQSRTPTEQTDWNKMFRRRQTNNTNWRQGGRDDDEWRQDNPRASNRTSADKWDRDWGERPTQDRPQGWNSNRRSRVGDSQNEDNLPEWAVDSTEGGGAGTFDSSGAFHGCSNDDSNLPRAQEPFTLTRSHTQGSFAHRSVSIEEGSEEWWASEKAKKLSPKRFESGDARFKRSQSASANETSSGSSIQVEEKPEIAEKSKSENSNTTDENNKNNDSKPKYTETQTFDAHMIPERDYDDNGEEHGNFQSVMITTNNSLRQKHQNIVASTSATSEQARAAPNNVHDNQTPEEQIMENFLDLQNEKPHKAPMVIPNIQSPSSTVTNTPSTPQNNIQMLMTPTGPKQGIALNNPAPVQSPIQSIGITNSALNSSLGLPIGSGTNGIGVQMQGLPSAIQNTPINNPIGSPMQPRSIIGGFHSNNGMSVMQGQNLASSLFLNQNSSTQIPPSNELPISNVTQNHTPNMHQYPLLTAMQHTSPQASYRGMYNNTLTNTGTGAPNTNNLAEQWFYEDPNKTIQGPFTSRDMYNWYRAGFFNSSLMVRRGCDAHLRPLGSYGPIVPFVQMDIMSPFSITGFDSRPPASHEILNQQPTLGIEDTLWSQPSTSRDLLWMQQPVNTRNDTGVNNLPMFFWDQQPTSAISSNSLLPEEIAKEMKTEDQILAQLRAAQNTVTSQPVQFLNDTQMKPTSIITSEDFSNAVKATPDLEELHKLIQKESLLSAQSSTTSDIKMETSEPEVKDKSNKIKIPANIETNKTQQTQNKVAPEAKQLKQAKNESEKGAKSKENNITKSKNKKNKDEKKEEVADVKIKEEDVKVEKRSAESSPSKSKKEDKQNKKDIEREKKEWVKEGFTIVKGPEKSVFKESKKKVEEAKIAEEADRKKREEEKLAAEEEKKRKALEALKKQQEQQPKPLESLIKKAPWSSVATQAISTSKDGPTLAEIQRLEREKKLEQMKEQQQMMHIIAQQQAAAVAREQEMQAVVGWAKKKSSYNVPGQSLAEIQAETKRQSAAAAAAAAAAQAIEDAQSMTAQAANHVPWGNAHNGGGFWDTQPNPLSKPEKTQETAKAIEPSKNKKKLSVAIQQNKKENSPAVEFESWCNSVLSSWSYKIDVPTFVGFLKDIESPYEVKDYIKCYLDDSKDSNDFARQFLERRSKLLRVGMVTPSDDLCSPATAINPRTLSASDYQEVKGKGKKTKKNKMLKVDARILGFSVTAAEDRINVGDIDTV